MKAKKTTKKSKTQSPQITRQTLLIAAGGTGGHITPGISIAEAWLAAGGRIVFATLIKNLDYPDIARMAPDERVSIVAYDAPRARVDRRIEASVKLGAKGSGRAGHPHDHPRNEGDSDDRKGAADDLLGLKRQTFRAKRQDRPGQ